MQIGYDQITTTRSDKNRNNQYLEENFNNEISNTDRDVEFLNYVPNDNTEFVRVQDQSYQKRTLNDSLISDHESNSKVKFRDQTSTNSARKEPLSNQLNHRRGSYDSLAKGKDLPIQG